MRVATIDNRFVLLSERGAVDVERASSGRFSSDPSAIFTRWSDFTSWAARADLNAVEPSSIENASFGPPNPHPIQVFAVGLNYQEHATEGGYEGPAVPSVFTKFPTCLTGQDAAVLVATPQVDWEIELVAVIGRRAHEVPREDAWSYVAGLTIGQDISARDVQHAGTSPQFSLGKSFPGFGPTGPWLVTPDELENPDDLQLTCRLNGEVVQQARTSEMIRPIPDLIAHISSICPMLPGDILFTGTPAGVGFRRDPPRFLQPGDELSSTIDGIGTLRTRFVSD